MNPTTAAPDREDTEAHEHSDLPTSSPLPDDENVAYDYENGDATTPIYEQHEHSLPYGPGNEETVNEELLWREMFGSFPFDGDTAVHESLKVTKGQVLSLVLAFYIRHGLTKCALQDLLSLVNCIIPNCVPPSKYFIERYLLNSNVQKTRHLYCPVCMAMVNVTAQVCSICHATLNASEALKNGHFFWSCSLQEQLKTFLEHENLMKFVSLSKEKIRSPDSKSEIFTGDEYLNNAGIQNFVRDSMNLTLSFNSDGVQPFNSGPKSLWPVLCTINELDIRFKSKFVMLSSLWFASKKPNPDSYMQPFVEEGRKLFREGVTWRDKDGNVHRTRVMVLLSTFDSVARPMFSAMTQYNGLFGCTFCFHPGVSIRTGRGNGNVRCYPVMIPFPPQRTHENTVTLGRLAVETQKRQQGVKGLSRLLLLPGYNSVNGTVPDSMHACWLGITNQFLGLWLDGTNTSYYIGNRIEQIDEIMLNGEPISEILRTQRSLDHRHYYKASEFRNFTMFYSAAAVSDFLPAKFFRHWLLFVNCMRLLFAVEVSRSNIRIARQLAYTFVAGIPELYGVQHVSFNCHLLIHIVECTERWGAPWAYSAFMYEDIGGTLAKIFNGTTHVCEQIIGTFFAISIVRKYAARFISDASENIQDVYENLLHYSCTLSGNIPNKLIGKGRVTRLDHSYIVAIEDHFRPIFCHYAFSYSKIAVNGKLFTTSSYADSFKRNNSVVVLKDGTYCKILNIFFLHPDCYCNVNDGSTLHQCYGNVVLEGNVVIVASTLPLKISSLFHRLSGINLLEFMKQLDENTPSQIIAFSPKNIQFKCVTISKNGETYFVVHDMQFEKG